MDVEALAAENADLRAGRAADAVRIAADGERIALLEDKLETLALELARLKKQVIGPKSERRTGDDGQLGLFDAPEPPSPEPASSPAAKPVATPHGRRLPEGEPDQVLDAPAPDCCPGCGGALRKIGESSATRFEWRRGHYFTMRINRPSCACDTCRTVHTAPEPSEFALPRSIVGNGLAAQIVVDKFADNIPLNRQATRFERDGLALSASTLGDTVRGVAGLLARIVVAMKKEQLEGNALQADDTGLPVLDGEAGRAVAGRLWVYADSRNVVYDFTPTKHGTGPAAYLAKFKGVILADGGSEFNEAVRNMGLTRAGCWSHARRYFVDAEETSPVLAREAIGLIGEIFAIERRPGMDDPVMRARARSTDTQAAIAAVRAFLEKHAHGLRPKSPIGQAVRYALNQFEFLSACIDHPEIPVHNNLSELQLRRPVIGRKNWLFAGSEGGARSAAILFSITGSCRLHRINPAAYLLDVLGRINDHPVNRIAELTPANWAPG